MKAKTCLEAFVKGKADSKKYPRTQGAYKLSEVLDRSKRREKEVGRIAKALKDPSSRYDLMHCTYEDMHVWLLDILEHVAYELSATVIPSFKALTGDGMTQSQIDQNLPYVERRSQDVLQELERARQTIKGKIHDEYDRMRRGESVVGDALTHTREMLEEIIDLTPPDIQRCIYPAIQEVQCGI